MHMLACTSKHNTFCFNNSLLGILTCADMLADLDSEVAFTTKPLSFFIKNPFHGFSVKETPRGSFRVEADPDKVTLVSSQNYQTMKFFETDKLFVFENHHPLTSSLESFDDLDQLEKMLFHKPIYFPVTFRQLRTSEAHFKGTVMQHFGELHFIVRLNTETEIVRRHMRAIIRKTLEHFESNQRFCITVSFNEQLKLWLKNFALPIAFEMTKPWMTSGWEVFGAEFRLANHERFCYATERCSVQFQRQNRRNESLKRLLMTFFLPCCLSWCSPCLYNNTRFEMEGRVDMDTRDKPSVCSEVVEQDSDEKPSVCSEEVEQDSLPMPSHLNTIHHASAFEKIN
eukprot:m.162119 g.162119  ORF g.162119 m.162119 type:complete len:341 (+) comp38834_c0_seq2:360-1382(+)